MTITGKVDKEERKGEDGDKIKNDKERKHEQNRKSRKYKK